MRILLALLLFTATAMAQSSVLVFPYYTSDSTGNADSVLSITNTTPNKVGVRLFFMEGATCYQADTLEQIAPNATLDLKTSFWDPMVTGYLIAIAVDQDGCPINAITGNAFVRTPAGYFSPGSGEVRGSYAPSGFNARSKVMPANNELTLNFGTTFDPVPTGFSVPIQNPIDAPGQTIVLAGLSGSVTYATVTGVTQLGYGQIINKDGLSRSFPAFLTGSCWGKSILKNTLLPNGVSNFIASGTTGRMQFSTVAAVGLLITPKNAAGWSGIRPLDYTRTKSVTLTVPSYF